MKLYRTNLGFFVEEHDEFYGIGSGATWDALITRDDLYQYLFESVRNSQPIDRPILEDLEAPIGSQEVWAAGVTYYRSRNARMEESKSAGSGDFYNHVYTAERPELFFKSTPHRVVGPNGKVGLRKDASWSVPEPELTLLITPNARIVGYTIGNDMSSRDIEGENPLYLPQAKVYDRSCALGPCILVPNSSLPRSTEIRLEIHRSGMTEFSGSTTLESMKRDPAILVEFLFRNNSFPNGCFLLTGTGIVPPDSFTLKSGDEIRISIAGIGTLMNFVG
ncbi:MAG: fumarylacetoacetate hydrolase family protein [Acidobacteriaceae bacterium]|nr:fumarylacetoacetate hydrolase family protein [Acidobacteriaceae bacterium]MBV9781503.1 fumarylacetoacetate hydrolase family protein [Acidobacteriaceae bacterium]